MKRKREYARVVRLRVTILRELSEDEGWALASRDADYICPSLFIAHKDGVWEVGVAWRGYKETAGGFVYAQVPERWMARLIRDELARVAA